MDSLINSVKNFKIDGNCSSFENDLNGIITKMENLETIDSEVEWETLKSNYSKLRYLDYLVKNMVLPDKFNISLDLFLNNIDTNTQRYLAKIDFELESYPKDILKKTKKVKELLENSLNCSGVIKMKYILDAYKYLVKIVEAYTDDTFKDFIDDQSFLRTFSAKRQKIN
jgi:hypothetical protein